MIEIFNKLSARERTLALIVGGALIVILNVVALKSFFKYSSGLRENLATQTINYDAQQELLKQKDFWNQRDAWLRSKQPVLTNVATAGGQLLDRITELAKAHHVTIDSPAISEGVTRGLAHQAVSVTMQAKCSWPDLIAFFTALQQPDSFIVPESAGVRIDPDDKTKMRSQLRISKWYAL